MPEILPSKSRTESETLKRRKEMEIQIEQNERERLETARPEDGVRRHTLSPVVAEPADSSHGVNYYVMLLVYCHECNREGGRVSYMYFIIVPKSAIASLL